MRIFIKKNFYKNKKKCPKIGQWSFDSLTLTNKHISHQNILIDCLYLFWSPQSIITIFFIYRNLIKFMKARGKIIFFHSIGSGIMEMCESDTLFYLLYTHLWFPSIQINASCTDDFVFIEPLDELPFSSSFQCQ